MGTEFKNIEGGVCAAEGFQAGGIHCGVRKNPNKKDLAMIYSETECNAAGVFTTNQVKAAPVMLDMETIKSGKSKAIIVDSGNANACAPNGMKNAKKMQSAAAAALGIDEKDVLVASTGIIGEELNIGVIEEGIPVVAGKLAHSPEASEDAAHGIMTTDTFTKQHALELEIGGKTVHMGGIAKGSGMIHPNMGTMLAFITTDCAITSEMLKKAVKDISSVTFNRISVDGDTSTNDTMIALANGKAGNAEITAEGEELETFEAALKDICTKLARNIAADGEGAQHLITCTVTGASDEKKAETIAKSVISSSLTKAAIFGKDANWGRVLCAMGYSGAEFDPSKVKVDFRSDAGQVTVYEGEGLVFDEKLAEDVLSEHEVVIYITMQEGTAEATCWGCDLTYDYVKINGSYRS